MINQTLDRNEHKWMRCDAMRYIDSSIVFQTIWSRLCHSSDIHVGIKSFLEFKFKIMAKDIQEITFDFFDTQ